MNIDRCDVTILIIHTTKTFTNVEEGDLDILKKFSVFFKERWPYTYIFGQKITVHERDMCDILNIFRQYSDGVDLVFLPSDNELRLHWY